ncbi:MAG TPA: hypothetical protein PKZ35_13465 [Gammaproteobacteria bacterium]|nr:hypothetical protein [Chromatiaceae bacterium]HPE81000.1 hypothetical protein [Gammaproteobacteria bacterium]
MGVLGVVGTSAPHAVPVELGTRPHFPPLAPLVDWVRAKLDITDPQQAVSVAMSIQRKIGAHGTKGKMMFHRAFADLSPQIEGMYERAHRSILEHLSNANKTPGD